jgi:hypothetical protein
MTTLDAAARASFPRAGKGRARRGVLQDVPRDLLPILVGAFATAAVTLAVALAATRHEDPAGATTATAGAPRVALVLDARAASLRDAARARGGLAAVPAS